MRSIALLLFVILSGCSLHSGSTYKQGEMGAPTYFKKGVILSVRDIEIPDNIKVQMIEKLAEADFRLSEGANSRIQIEAVVANFAILGRHLQK